jgi:3-phosphoshikimate 1-carboxyvinyltransferase
MKETDRVAVMAEELGKLGAKIEIGSDYMLVHGKSKLHGAKVSSHGDHRVAMALLVCGLGIDDYIEVENSECAAVSFPGFFDVMGKMGANIITSEE